jgi:hypothetical protein
MRRLMVAALFTLLVACGSDSTGPELTVAGAWSGTGSGITLQLTLSVDADGAVSGSGNISGASLTTALAVTQGTYVDPNVSLVLHAEGYEDINLTGTLQAEGNQIVGTLNGSGFTGFVVVLNRQ